MISHFADWYVHLSMSQAGVFLLLVFFGTFALACLIGWWWGRRPKVMASRWRNSLRITRRSLRRYPQQQPSLKISRAFLRSFGRR